MRPCPTHSSVSHNHALAFSVSCLQLSHIFKCITYPSAYSFGVTYLSASHNYAYPFSASHIQVPYVQVPPIIMPIHSVSRTFKCIASSCLFARSRISECLLVRCPTSNRLTYPSVQSAYSFNVSHYYAIHSVSHIPKRPHIQAPIHSMSHVIQHNKVAIYRLSKYLA